MKFLENDLENIIYDSNKIELAKRGLNIKGTVLRQLRLGNYGVADLVSFSKGEYDLTYGGHDVSIITVYELKKDAVGYDTLGQALRYVQGIKRYLKLRGVMINYIVKIVLVGRKISDTYDFSIGMGGFDGLAEVYTYDYSLNGLIFKKESGYYYTNEYFNIKKTLNI